MKITALTCLLIFSSFLLIAQPGVEIVSYINTYKDLAMQEMQRTGVPASIKLAQGIHETSAGKSDLVMRSNNHFGIKCKSNWVGGKVYHDDDERGECFRSYQSSEDSYRDHSDFLKNSQRYAFLFSIDPTDYKGWAYGLKKAGYATNIKYSQILIRIIEQYNLNQYTLIAMNRLPAGGEQMARVPTPEATSPVAPIVQQVAVNAAEPAPPVDYPSGEFQVNRTRVIYASKGSSLLEIAEKYHLPYSRLLEFNDLEDQDVLETDQLIYLQRKRKSGSSEFHLVKPGETLYSIAQLTGIRLNTLAEMNHLQPGMNPAPGEKLHLQNRSAQRPVLATERMASPLVLEPLLTERSTHIVQTRETLYSISKKYGVEIDKIREWNKLNGFDLKIGQELVIIKN